MSDRKGIPENTKFCYVIDTATQKWVGYVEWDEELDSPTLDAMGLLAVHKPLMFGEMDNPPGSGNYLPVFMAPFNLFKTDQPFRMKCAVLYPDLPPSMVAAYERGQTLVAAKHAGIEVLGA